MGIFDDDTFTEASLPLDAFSANEEIWSWTRVFAPSTTAVQSFCVTKDSTIGRSIDATIPLEDKRTSRLHVVVKTVTAASMGIEVVGRSAIKVNRQPVSGVVKLRDNDCVRLGDSVFIVRKRPLRPSLPSEEIEGKAPNSPLSHFGQVKSHFMCKRGQLQMV